MLIAAVKNIKKQFSGYPILNGVSFKISAGQKLGLIGPNGCGKTTLLRILSGVETPDSGTVQIAAGMTLGYVPQHVEYEPGQTVSAIVLTDYDRIAAQLRKCEAGLACAPEAEIEKRMREYQTARDVFDRIGGETYAARAMAMLDALGLTDKADQEVKTLSGGEKNVLAMSRALMIQPDLLLLDEPGNHLDYQGLEWLENFLDKFKGAVLMVSHNRYLLDHVVDGILDFQEGRLKYYNGGYTIYRSALLQELVAQQSDYIANQKRLAQLEALVKKFEQIAQVNSDPAWGKRLRARRTQLKREKDNAVEKPIFERKAMELCFSSHSSRANIAVRIRGYCRVYGDKTLFDQADLDIACGEKIALAGLNGSGKTTLLKDIVKEGAWDNSIIQVGPSLRIGFCAQEQEVLDPDSTLLAEVLRTAPLSRGEATAILLKFLFPYEHHNKRIADLSGGERNRLQLARLILLKPNFLILDEPTNHLDIQAREIVEEALTDIDCTLLVVSHDRYFLDKIVNRVIEIDKRKLVSYPGNFTEYWMSKRELKHRASGRIQARRKEREKTIQSKDATKAMALEKRINDLEAEIETLERHISEAFSRRDHQEGRRAGQALKKTQTMLNDLSNQWMAIVE